MGLRECLADPARAGSCPWELALVPSSEQVKRLGLTPVCPAHSALHHAEVAGWGNDVEASRWPKPVSGHTQVLAATHTGAAWGLWVTHRAPWLWPGVPGLGVFPSPIPHHPTQGKLGDPWTHPTKKPRADRAGFCFGLPGEKNSWPVGRTSL